MRLLRFIALEEKFTAFAGIAGVGCERGGVLPFGALPFEGVLPLLPKTVRVGTPSTLHERVLENGNPTNSKTQIQE